VRAGIGGGCDRARGSRVKLPRGLLSTLRERELELVGRAMGAETGGHYREMREGGRVVGIYRRSLMLASAASPCCNAATTSAWYRGGGSLRSSSAVMYRLSLPAITSVGSSGASSPAERDDPAAGTLRPVGPTESTGGG
jgi:hypothetical protein